MQLKPLFNQILLELVEKTSPSGLTIPESAQANGDAREARVLAVGPGHHELAAKVLQTSDGINVVAAVATLEGIMRDLRQVHEGDIVLIPVTAGYRVGDKKRIVQETEILAVVASAKTI